MRLKLLIIALMVLAFGLAGCANRKTDAALSRAESIVDSRPDSALLILRSIAPSALKTPDRQALYGLLLTRASDCCYQDIAALDSLIIPAERYFSTAADPRRDMLAKHCLARVRLEQGDPNACILLDLKALEIAQSLKNFYIAGMAAQNISDAYAETYNHADALKYAVISYEAIKEDGRQPHLNYALCNLAVNHLANEHHEEGRRLALQSLDSAGVYNDDHLACMASGALAYSYFNTGEYDKAIKMMESVVSSGEATVEDMALLGSAYMYAGEETKARECMAAIGDTTNVNVKLFRYEFYHLSGDTTSAFNELGAYTSLLNKEVKGKIMQSFAGNTSDVYSELLQEEQQHAKTKRLIHYSVYLVLMGIVLLVGFRFYMVYKRQKSEIKETVSLAGQFEEKYNESKSRNERYRQTIRSLISSSNTLLDRLSVLFYESPTDAKAKKSVSSTVAELVEQVAESDKKNDEMAAFVDTHYENLYTNFKTEFPSLKKFDFRLFLYTVLGFSNNVISLFLREDKLSRISDRRRRIKERIKQSDSPLKEEYLKFFPQRSCNQEDRKHEADNNHDTNQLG